MKKTKKILALALAAVMLVCTTVAATVAYLTANTGVVNNTFTVDSVAIELDETDVDIYGVKDGNTRVKANQYKLIPGHKYVKDPEVRVVSGSEQSYVFIKVVNDISAIEATTKTIASQIAENHWKQLKDKDGNDVTNVYYYESIVDARTAEQKLPVFGEFTLKTDANVASLADAQGNVASVITIDAYAVQADGFANAAAAWEAAPTTWN